MTPPEFSKTSRRHALRLFGTIAGSTIAAACDRASTSTSPSSTTTTTTTTTSTTSTGTTTGACAVTAEETAGPYPDITGMLSNQAFYRRDIREGRPGLPLALTLSVVNTRNNCAALANAAVEIWQCDADGHYSEYAQPGYNGVGQTFLRGLQVTDAAGQVTFQTIYPGWYAGRATHIHVEIFVNGASVKTTQIAFPETTTRQIYAAGVYAAKGQNTITNATDNVFSDGTSTEMATLSGDTATGMAATLTIAVSA